MVFKGATNLIQIGDQWDVQMDRHVCHSQFQFLVETFCSSGCHSAKIVMGTAKHETNECVGGRKTKLPVGWIWDVNFELANLLATERIPKHFQQRLWGKLEGSLGVSCFLDNWLRVMFVSFGLMHMTLMSVGMSKLWHHLMFANCLWIFERKNMRYTFAA